MPDDLIARLEAVDVPALHRSHTHCDDSWYCCPVCDSPDHLGGHGHGGYFTRHFADRSCACGVESHNAALDQVAQLIREAIAALTAQGETAPAPVDDIVRRNYAAAREFIARYGARASRHHLLAAMDTVLAASAPLPPVEGLEQLARETAERIEQDAVSQEAYDICVHDAEKAAAIILAALTRARAGQ